VLQLLFSSVSSILTPIKNARSGTNLPNLILSDSFVSSQASSACFSALILVRQHVSVKYDRRGVTKRVNDLVSQGSDAKTIAPLVIGIVLLIAGGVNEMFTKRSAIIPARLFKVSSHAGLSTMYLSRRQRLVPLASFWSLFSFMPSSSLELHSK
jgi:hypothetical protein